MAHQRIGRSVVSRFISYFGMCLLLVLIGLYIYYLRTGKANQWLASIHHLGFLGIILGVLIQTLVNALPVPGEFISIMLIGVYGPVKGGIFSWIGGICRAVLGYYLSHWVARPTFERWTKPYIEKVNRWFKKRGDVGLLLLRFVPFVPYHLVNYAAGLLGLNMRAFIWTTAIGILPYTITVSSLFAGLRYGKLVPFIIGGGLFILSALLSIFLRKKGD